MRNGVIVNMVQSEKTPEQLVTSMSGFADMEGVKVIPVSDIPEGTLRNYQYWTERP